MILRTVLSILLLSCSNVFGIGEIGVIGGYHKAATDGVVVSPTAYFKFEASGGTGDQLYDEISSTWVGSGADTMTFVTGANGNAMHSDSDTDLAFIPASFFDFPVGGVITIRWKSNNTAANFGLYDFRATASGSTIYVQSSKGSALYRYNFGATYNPTDFTPAPIAGAFVEHYLVIDSINNTFAWYHDGTISLDSGTDSAIVGWGSSLVWGIAVAVSGSMSIDELRIYDEEVTP